MQGSKGPKRPRKGAKADPESIAAAEAAQACVTAQVSRDQSLSVYHAIGKLLHYKRNQEGASSGGAAAAAAGAPTQQQQQGDGDGMDAEGSTSQQQQGRYAMGPQSPVVGSTLATSIRAQLSWEVVAAAMVPPICPNLGAADPFYPPGYLPAPPSQCAVWPSRLCASTPKGVIHGSGLEVLQVQPAGGLALSCSQVSFSACASARPMCSLTQPPLRINPEGIIHGSGLEALQVTAFLAENYTHFMLEDAMDEAAEAAAALSDACGCVGGGAGLRLFGEAVVAAAALSDAGE